MRILMGNVNPIGVPGPTITASQIKDTKDENGNYTVGYLWGTQADDVRQHFTTHAGPVTHMPGQGVILGVLQSWKQHSLEKPAWVAVIPEEREIDEAADIERFFAEFWECRRGIPHNVEDTYYTDAGPPLQLQQGRGPVRRKQHA